MIESQRRKKKRNHGLVFFLIMLLLGAVWFLLFYKYSVIKILKNKFVMDQKVEHIEQLKKERQVLEGEKQKLAEEDPETIEKKARELGLAKEGETIIRIKKTDPEEGQ